MKKTVANIANNINQKKYGQYFTTNEELQEKVFEWIFNNPAVILEPSVGRGDLVVYCIEKMKTSVVSGGNDVVQFDMYEIDKSVSLLNNSLNVVYGDFLQQPIEIKYKTIIGNPPFVKTKSGNVYIDFIEKCFYLLENAGELIFIIPSIFFHLTSASHLLNRMMMEGTFTHIFHPHNEKMFDNATIDVLVFRYCKDVSLTKICLYNDTLMNITNNKGFVSFEEKNNKTMVNMCDYFDIYVGMVSGKEDVFKNETLGNICILNGKDKVEKYICLDTYPCETAEVNSHLLNHKEELQSRKIRKFNEQNWFEWGALRNKKVVDENLGEDCIYIYNLTRNPIVAFVDRVQYFGGNLILLKPKKKCCLTNAVSYFNSDEFKKKFMFSGRFKIGHRSLYCSCIPLENL